MVRPSIPRGFSLKSVRNGDTLTVYVPEFNDSGTGRWSFSELPAFGGEGGASTATANNSGLDTATAVLYRNGKQIAASNNGAWGNSEVPPGKATYKLDLTTARESDDWHFATDANTSWTFHSDTATRATMLPRLQLDYVVPVDAKNAVDRARTHKVGFNVRMKDGMPAPRGVNLKAEASYEDGKNWTTAHAARRGSDGQFIAKLLRPSTYTATRT